MNFPKISITFLVLDSLLSPDAEKNANAVSNQKLAAALAPYRQVW